MSARKPAKKRLVGIYSRKLLFFGLLFVLSLGFIQYTAYQKFSADEMYEDYEAAPEESTTINVEILSSGDYTVDGEKSGKLKTVGDKKELNFKVLDKPEEYINDLIVNVKLPEPVADESEYKILAIHGVESSFAKKVDLQNLEYRAYGVGSMATVTVIAQIPRSAISEPFLPRVIDSLSSLKFNFWVILAIVLPVLTLIYMILFTAFQMRLNKVDQPDQETNQPPMAIPPALVGVLFHQKVGAREVAATLIDLAKRKDIVILDRDRGFAFGKGRFDDRLLPYEKILLSKIFRNNITSEQKYIEERIASHLYSKKISIVSAGIYALATRLGYFRYNPRRVHAKYRLYGILAFLLGAAGFVLSYLLPFLPAFTALFWVGMMISALIVAFTASRIPLRTPLGNEALSNWLAFRKFLSNPEPIEYSPEVYGLFEQYLPYAVVLDCEASWARRFEKHNFLLPEWFLTDKEGLGLDDFCLALFPIVSYVGRSFAAIREPGFE